MINGVAIVPEHIWSKVDDPTTFTNSEDPVGTGPMKVKAFNPQQLTIERNPDYWQADKVKVQELKFHKADAGGQVEQLKLSRGEYDMNAHVHARHREVLRRRDPEHNHYWFPPGGVISRLHEPDQGAVQRRRVPARASTTRSTATRSSRRPSSATSSRPARPAWCCPARRTGCPTGIENEGKIPYDADAGRPGA